MEIGKDRTITLTRRKIKIFHLCVSKMIPNKNTDVVSIRTIQKKEKSPSNYIDTKSLKKIEPEKTEPR